MSLKEFYKPSIWKIIIFVILILFTIFIPKTAEMCSMGVNVGGIVCGQNPAQGIGYPLFFGTKFLGDVQYGFGLYPLNLLINIIIFYSISCGIVALYNKITKK